MLLEVIATRLTDAVLAERSGADRIELVMGIREGGLTPSYGLIKQTLQSVLIPVNVMVRPHSLNFHYDKQDIQTMLEDIRFIRAAGANGIVLGVLTEERRIDVETLGILLEEAGELEVTFHRAFDEIEDQFAALETLSRFPTVKRVLTSGGRDSVLQAVERIEQLIRAAESTHLNILAGAGLTVESLRAFIRETGVKEVHFGSGVRLNNDIMSPIEPNLITVIRSIFKEAWFE